VVRTVNSFHHLLLINGWDLTLDEEELVGLVLGVAAGRIDKNRLTAVFLDRCDARAS
jgi:prophage maintenance system killer protein